MIDEHDVREMLQRRADAAPATPADTPTVVLRARRRLALNGAVATVAAAAIAVATFAGIDAIRSAPIPADDRTEELGIFAPVAGRIVYESGIDRGDSPGFWAVDPNGPVDTEEGLGVAENVASTLVPLELDGEPLGWSSDGTELLLMRSVGDDLLPEQYLSILHADGSETRLNQDPIGISSATISPDGTRVVFAGQYDLSGLYVIDAEGGRPVPLPIPQAEDGASEPTFSPDGTQIAYLAGNGEAQVWVANADGTDAHEILADEPTVLGEGLQWSPAGDHLAIGVGDYKGSDGLAIYTFAHDGSDFTRVTTEGISPYWSPDGSQIAYTIPCDEHPDNALCPEGSGRRSQFDLQPGGRPAGLAIANVDGSNVRAFGFAASGPWHPGSPVEDAPATIETPAPVETDGEVLGFTGGPDGEPGALVAVNSQTGESRVLVSDLPVVHNARWSADRRWVAYEDDAGLWVVGPEQEPRPVTSGSLPLWLWSPEGARLAILEGSSLSILDVASESTTALGMVTGDVTSAPVWSPDGTRLVYGARGGTVSSIDIGSGERSLLIEMPGDDLDSMDEIDWSSDGRWLAINYDVEPGVARLYLVDADGSDVLVLCDDNGDNDECGGMAWSPDGARLAYLENVGTGQRILTQTPHGDSPVLVGNADFGSCAFGGCGLPVWSPDGSRIGIHGGFYNSGAIFLAVDADRTGNAEPIDGMTYQSWYDGSYSLDWFRTGFG